MQDKPSYKGRGGLTEKMQCRLTSAARCAIKMRSKESDISKGVKLLERDLLNGPYHCFGHHERCSPDFCLSAKERLQSFRDTSGEGAAREEDADGSVGNDELAGKFPVTISVKKPLLVYIQDPHSWYITHTLVSAEVILDQRRMWEQTLADDPATEREARHGGPAPTEIDTQMMHDIQVLVDRLVMKAQQLIRNFTTNLVEGWMKIRCKFDGGKVVNRSQSGSWEHRCSGAGLQQNLGRAWGPPTWEKITSSPPSTRYSSTQQNLLPRK